MWQLTFSVRHVTDAIPMIRQERAKYKMSQRALGRRINATYATMQATERRGPTFGILYRIAAGLGAQLLLEVSSDARRGPWVRGSRGKLLRACRRYARLEQAELAAKVGISQNMVSIGERGRQIGLRNYLSLIRATRCHLRLSFEKLPEED